MASEPGRQSTAARSGDCLGSVRSPLAGVAVRGLYARQPPAPAAFTSSGDAQSRRRVANDLAAVPSSGCRTGARRTSPFVTGRWSKGQNHRAASRTADEVAPSPLKLLIYIVSGITGTPIARASPRSSLQRCPRDDAHTRRVVCSRGWTTDSVPRAPLRNEQDSRDDATVAPTRGERCRETAWR